MRPTLLPTLAAAALLAASAQAQTTENFEAYAVAVGGAENLNVLTLDENTIANGQGPNLVANGCVYSCAIGTLQWNGQAWFGQPSKDLLANSGDGLLTLTYDNPVSAIALELLAFSGYPDTTVVTVYNSSNGVLSSTSHSVPGSSPVPYSYTGSDIKKVTIQSTVWPWSTIIDNHVFGGPTFTLAKSGSCPGPVTLTTTNGTPSNAVAIVYGNAGSWTKPSGTCAGLTLGIANPNLGAIIGSNGAGSASISFNSQAAWCGKTVQAVDVATCTASNTITL